ncbi:uncharacterized protein LOC122258325 [Penaeus japonicus]|uniref:uncharacterized protein LOC122258325 n=1 Tax=Penaeus japonicus TaxID=27405 RepID=UPI001C70B238|nr:uncharacterized protein LOC122258325 [Penaeus japonicus]XP_042880095.1 uncharacterized protein LOC122258325 [Penaeus japonicus]
MNITDREGKGLYITHRIMSSLKRLWLLRSRSRSLLRSAALVSILASVAFLFNSAFLLDDSVPLPRSLSEPQSVSTASSLTLQLTQSQLHQDRISDSKDKLPSQVSSDKDDFFNPYKGKVIERNEIKKKRGRDKKLESAVAKKEPPSSKTKGPSFGFVNSDFKPPYDPDAPNPIMQTFQNFINGEYGVNPGTVLGAVAALQKSKSFNKGDGISSNSNQGVAGDPRPSMPSEAIVSNSSNKKTNDILQAGSSGRKSLRDGNAGDKPRGEPIVRPPKKHDDARGTKPNIIGSLLSQIGPSILQGALSKAGHSGKGNAGGQSQANPLMNLFSQVGPSLLNGVLQKGPTHSNQGQENRGESSPLQSVMSGLGPLLLAGAVSQGLGGSGRDAQSPIQSLLSNLGPQLMGSVLKQGFGVGQGRSQNPSPVESIISGLGPVLGNVMQGSFQENNSKSPVVSILSGLGSSLLSGLSKRGQGNTRYNDASKHSMPRQDPRMPPRDRGRNASSASLPKASPSGLPHFREGGSSRREEEVKREVPSGREGEQELPARTGNDGDAAAPNPLLRLVAQGVLENWLPERVSIPEPNSTRGAWGMAVNLALGNPKDHKGRHSQFWSWMRKLSGSEQSRRTFSWISQALDNPSRSGHAHAISEFYDAITNVQPICESVATVGGLYNWKKDALEGSKAVCMDPDVSPKKRDCLVYSFGVRDEWSFEEEMEKYGCEVWAFDPAMTTGNHNHSKYIHFYNIGLAAANTTREVHGRVWNLFTYPAVVTKLGHAETPVSYLNLDASGSEWEVMKEVMQDNSHILTNVHQLGVRVHLDQALKNPALYKVNADILRDLEGYGFQLFSSRKDERKENIYFDPLLKRDVSLTYDLVFLRI